MPVARTFVASIPHSRWAQPSWLQCHKVSVKAGGRKLGGTDANLDTNSDLPVTRRFDAYLPLPNLCRAITTCVAPTLQQWFEPTPLLVDSRTARPLR
jgi:hypothetical protein